MRPPEYLDDVRLRELEMQAAEARLVQLDYELCPHCEYEVKADYLRCPSCMRKLKDRCHVLRQGRSIPRGACARTARPRPGPRRPPSSGRRRRRGATTSEDAVAEAPPRATSSR